MRKGRKKRNMERIKKYAGKQIIGKKEGRRKENNQLNNEKGKKKIK